MWLIVSEIGMTDQQFKQPMFILLYYIIYKRQTDATHMIDIIPDDNNLYPLVVNIA